MQCTCMMYGECNLTLYTNPLTSTFKPALHANIFINILRDCLSIAHPLDVCDLTAHPLDVCEIYNLPTQ